MKMWPRFRLVVLGLCAFSLLAACSKGGTSAEPDTAKDAQAKAQHLPIGSGIVEAACKTLVAQRLKLSGMRWAPRGAQAILTMRGWDQSERFDQAWALVAATYHRDVHVIAQIVDINAPRKKPTRRRTSG